MSKQQLNLKIESNIEIPPKSVNQPSKYTTVLSKMKIGDSITLNRELKVGFRVAATKYGFKVITRKVSDNKIRIWRTK